MKRKPYGKQSSFWVNRCPECNELTGLSLRKQNARLCAACSAKAEAKHREHTEGKREKANFYLSCPVCGEKVKATTLAQHFEKVHPHPRDPQA